MRFDKKNILFIFCRFYLLLLYIPFFIVQGFLNFDAQCYYHANSTYTRFGAESKNQQEISYYNTNKLLNKKVCIRLNKRFQPENAPILITPFLEMAVYCTNTNILYTYPDPISTSPHLLANKLRGPPVIA